MINEIADNLGDRNITIARQAIINRVEGEGTVLPTAGTISPCPVCGRGNLEYYVFENRDIHAQCTARVPRCVEWVE